MAYLKNLLYLGYFTNYYDKIFSFFKKSCLVLKNT